MSLEDELSDAMADYSDDCLYRALVKALVETGIVLMRQPENPRLDELAKENEALGLYKAHYIKPDGRIG